MMDRCFNIWLIILFTFMVFFLVVAKIYSYNKYLSYFGQVVDEKTIKIFILKEDIPRITNNLIINKRPKSCITSSISSTYTIDNNYNKYYEVLFECDLTDIEFNNYIFDIKIDLGKTTIIETIKNQIKKGLLYERIN